MFPDLQSGSFYSALFTLRQAMGRPPLVVSLSHQLSDGQGAGCDHCGEKVGLTAHRSCCSWQWDTYGVMECRRCHTAIQVNRNWPVAHKKHMDLVCQRTVIYHATHIPTLTHIA